MKTIMKIKLLLALSILLTLNAYAQFPVNGLVGQYGFENGAVLVDGANGNNFTQTGTSLTEINDRFGVAPTSAIELNSDYLTRTNIDYPQDTFGYGNNATISFWIKTTTNSPDIKTIIDDTNGRSSQTDTDWAGYYVYLRDGKVGVSLRVQYNGNLGYRGGGKLANIVISDGNWHHIAIRLSDSRNFVGNCTTLITSSAGIYVDGIDYATGGSQEDPNVAEHVEHIAAAQQLGC